MKKIKIPSREEIVEFYITQCHSKDETCEHFEVSPTTFSRWLKNYGILKTQDEMNKTKQNKYSNQELLDQINQKRKLTTLKKYGYEHIAQVPTVRKKTQDTCLGKYGRLYAINSPVVQEKIKNTCLEKYGVDNVFKLKDFQDKAKETIKNKYCILQLQDKTKQTNLEKYGVPFVLQSPQIREKIQETCLEKYGVPFVSQSDNIKDKKVQTCQKHFGTNYPLQNVEIQNKAKNTCLEKYGVDNVFKSKDFQDKVKDLVLDKYSVLNYNQFHINHLDIWLSADKFKNFLLGFDIKPTVRELMEEFNVSDVAIGLKAKEYQVCELIDFRPSRSRYEDEIIKLLTSLGVTIIQSNDRTVLEGQEIDIYLPDYKIGIEFNGDYWHSDIYHSDHNGRSTYHQEKSLLAEKKGVFLFHIFEHEWNDPSIKQNILNRLTTLLQKNSIKIPGRKCEIVELDKQQKKDFLNENHIQGNDHSSKYYGLKYNGEIVSCMTFVHPKNDKYTWELSRFCNKHGYIVQGGASKLFSYFVKTLEIGDTISSYNDITKTQGKLYEVLGFECVSINNPNYVWINFQTGDIRTRYQEQAAGEVERMHELGYHRVCDCGTKTWVYTKERGMKYDS